MKINPLYDSIRRECFNLAGGLPAELYYIVEKKEWSINWDGKYITQSLNSQNLISADIGYRRAARLAKKKILHFGSRNLYLPDTYKQVHQSNKVVFTWFHGTEEDVKFIEALPKCVDYTDVVHTSCHISRNNLINWGIPEGKITVIPLGVDLGLFKPISAEEKQTRRAALNIPTDKLVVGSFQKDGQGWQEGLEPKLIKGPDTLAETIIAINERYPVHALLIGPARGYVKQRLDQANITYTHLYFDDFTRVAHHYPLADICLITSRAEGGPKALLEGMASGVPVVSTRMGMPADVIINEQNGMISAIEDVYSLAAQCIKLAEDSSLREKIVLNALREIQDYSWARIAQRYHAEIYSQLV